MPDYPPIEGLKAAVDRRIQPIPAGAASPVVLRAAEALRKTYPADMYGTKVADMPTTDPRAFSDVGAYTPIDMSRIPGSLFSPHSDQESMVVNPALSATYPQTMVEDTMAHELEHVRQGRTQDVMDRIRQHSLPYEDRPNEKAAFDASAAYRHARYAKPSWKFEPPPAFLEKALTALGDMYVPRGKQ